MENNYFKGKTESSKHSTVFPQLGRVEKSNENMVHNNNNYKTNNTIDVPTNEIGSPVGYASTSKTLEETKKMKKNLNEYKCLETTFSKPGLKIVNSFHKETLEKVMFKIPIPKQGIDREGKQCWTLVNLDEECFIMFAIGKIPNSNDYFTQMKSYQEVEMAHNNKRFVLSMEAGISSMDDVLKYRRDLKIPYNEGNLIYIGYHLLMGLSLLKDKMIFHSDIKPGNIFLFQINGNWVYKIGDFGASIQCTKPHIKINVIKAGTKGYAIPELESFLNDEKLFDDKSFNIFEADLFSLGKTFKKMMDCGPDLDYSRIKNLIEDMEERKKPLDDILESFEKLLTYAKMPDEKEIELMSRKNLLKNYKQLMNFDKMEDGHFDTKSLYDVMEYCRVLEYYLLLRDFESIKLWRDTTIELFRDLLYRVFKDKKRAEQILQINIDILTASGYDEETYIQGEIDGKAVEQIIKKKDKLLQEICEKCDAIFPPQSLASHFAKYDWCNFYSQMQYNYHLNDIQKKNFQNVLEFNNNSGMSYLLKRMFVLKQCQEFFGFSETEEWVIDFKNKLQKQDGSLEEWIGAPPLDIYFKLQEYFSHLKIHRTKDEYIYFLSEMFNGAISFASTLSFLKRNDNILFPWHYLDPGDDKA